MVVEDHEGLVDNPGMQDRVGPGHTSLDVDPDVEAAAGWTCRRGLRVRCRTLGLGEEGPIGGLRVSHEGTFEGGVGSAAVLTR